MRRTAFTLLELLLVLAIIIVIAAMGTAGFQRQYARSQFKSGVVQLQVDLLSTRLLAMQSGSAYVFRYVPGSSVYEIAPLKTLQETLYRINGDMGQDDSDVLGGSLGLPAGASSSGMISASTLGVGAAGLAGTSQYTDDLFSYENILADLQAAEQANAREARLGATNVGLSTGLGGGLNSIGGVDSIGTLGASPSDALYGSNALFGTTLPTLGGMPTSVDPILGAAADPTGMGSQFALGELSTGQVQTTTIRELNVYEKKLYDENTLAWRVNADGAVIRKQTKGDVVFTFMRVSESTPSNLKTRRPGGVKGSETTSISGSTEGEDLGSSLGGSLNSIPTRSGDSSLLGGSLTEIAGSEDDTLESLLTQEEEAAPFSMWSDPLIFYPNGKTSNAVVGFASVGDYDFYSEITLRGMTGVARISSISSIPPGYNPATALTQEQLFRLMNPGVAYSGTNENSETSGGALGTADTAGALGTSGSSADGGLAPLGSDAGLTNALGGANDLMSSGFAPNYGTANEGVGYGSRERRSGYRFNESAGNDPAQTQLGAGMQNQSMPDVGGNNVGADFGGSMGGGNMGGAMGGNMGGQGLGVGGANGGNGTNANSQPENAFGAIDAQMQGGGLGGTQAPNGALGGDNSKDNKNEQENQNVGGAL